MAVVTILWILTASAGCSGSPSAAAAKQQTHLADDRPSEPSVRVGGGDSAIHGSVTDAELMPVAAVKIQIIIPAAQPGAADAQEVAAHLLTDDQGGFRATDLAPGAYLVYASKLGYDRVPPLRISIESGQATDVKIILMRSAAVESYHVTQLFRSISTAFCSSSTVKELQLTASGGCTTANGRQTLQPADRTIYSAIYEFYNNETRGAPLETIIAEAQWVPTQNYCGFGVEITLESPQKQNDVFVPEYNESLDPYRFSAATRSESPTWLIAQRTGSPTAMLGANRTELNKGVPIEVVGKWRSYSQTVPSSTTGTELADFSCWIDQWVENAVTLFYSEAADATWSAFNDA